MATRKFSWMNPKLEIREAGRYGKGIFAKERAKAGGKLAIFGGRVLHVSEEVGDYGIQIDEEFVMGGFSKDLNEIEDAYFFNHSCDPNACIRGQIALVAMRDINVGEQVTFDYAMCLHPTPGMPRYKMECMCGSTNCRGIITEDDWKLPDLQKKYDGYFSWYLQEKINEGTIPKIERVLLEIKPSNIVKGEVGVFAARNLIKGIIVGDSELIQESFFTWKDYERIENITQQFIDKFCLGNLAGFFAPLNPNYLSIPWFFNHSCSGNVGFDIHGNFVTIKVVKAGEELCYDYGLGEANPDFKMYCKCGSLNCRKIITGNDWKDPVFRKNNLEHMLPELR